MTFNVTGPNNVATGVNGTVGSSVTFEVFPYRKIDSVLVDGNRWYTIKCNKEVAAWIRTLPGEHTQWYEHLDSSWYINTNKFDITEQVYMQIGLKWM
mgnify:FL=1|jgi:hypothetical protein